MSLEKSQVAASIVDKLYQGKMPNPPPNVVSRETSLVVVLLSVPTICVEPANSQKTFIFSFSFFFLKLFLSYFLRTKYLRSFGPFQLLVLLNKIVNQRNNCYSKKGNTRLVIIES